MLRSLLLAVVAIGITLLLAEVVFRLVFPIPPTWREPQIRHQRSPLLGWVLPAGGEGFSIDVPVRVNALGLRDDEIPKAKPAGETRILCLGDSFTFALGVRFEDLYVQQLETRLRALYPDRAFQVINTGVAGYNTRQERIYLEAEGWDLDPDLVTIGFYFNDLIGNGDPLPDLENTPRVDDEDFREEPDHAIPGWIRDRLRQSVLLYQLVIRSKMLAQSLDPPTGDPTWRAQRAVLAGDEEALAPYLAETVPQLLAIAESARRRGVPVILLFFPMENQLHGDYPADVLTDALRVAWEPTGMPFIDLEPGWRAALEAGTNPFLPYDLHPSPAGMTVVADALLDTIERRGWLERGFRQAGAAGASVAHLDSPSAAPRPARAGSGQ